MASPKFERLGAVGAVLGPLLLFAYGWSEATFGPSQTYEVQGATPADPMRVAGAIQLVTAALFCFAIALLVLRTQPPRAVGHLERVGRPLAYLAAGLLAVGSFLWWPIILLGLSGRFGPVAGAPIALGTLGLLGAWALLALSALGGDTYPRWARPIPLGLLALSFVLFYLLVTRTPWALAATVFAPFALGWIALSSVMWSRGENAEPRTEP